MRISLRLDQLDSHAHFAVFVDGGKAGDLCLTRDEWNLFRAVVEAGCNVHGHAFKINDARKSNAK